MENVKRHTHNGMDSEQIDPTDLLPFPVYDSAPIFEAPNGFFCFSYDGTNYKIHVRINNTWVSGTLTA